MKATVTPSLEPYGLLQDEELMRPLPNVYPDETVVVYEGTSKALQLAVYNADGTAYDLTDHRLILSVRKRMCCDELPVFMKVSSDPTQIAIDANPRLGRAMIYLVPEDTKGRGPKDYAYDVWLETPGPDALHPSRVMQRFIIVGPATLHIEEAVTKL
jgi:hypothetical protein